MSLLCIIGDTYIYIYIYIVRKLEHKVLLNVTMFNQPSSKERETELKLLSSSINKEMCLELSQIHSSSTFALKYYLHQHWRVTQVINHELCTGVNG